MQLSGDFDETQWVVFTIESSLSKHGLHPANAGGYDPYELVDVESSVAGPLGTRFIPISGPSGDEDPIMHFEFDCATQRIVNIRIEGVKELIEGTPHFFLSHDKARLYVQRETLEAIVALPNIEPFEQLDLEPFMQLEFNTCLKAICETPFPKEFFFRLFPEGLEGNELFNKLAPETQRYVVELAGYLRNDHPSEQETARIRSIIAEHEATRDVVTIPLSHHVKPPQNVPVHVDDTSLDCTFGDIVISRHGQKIELLSAPLESNVIEVDHPDGPLTITTSMNGMMDKPLFVAYLDDDTKVPSSFCFIRNPMVGSSADLISVPENHVIAGESSSLTPVVAQAETAHFAARPIIPANIYIGFAKGDHTPGKLFEQIVESFCFEDYELVRELLYLGDDVYGHEHPAFAMMADELSAAFPELFEPDALRPNYGDFITINRGSLRGDIQRDLQQTQVRDAGPTPPDPIR